MNEFTNRLNILKSAGQIANDSIELANNIVDLFEQEYQIKLTEENGSMLITHAVMANERIKVNNPVNKLDDAIVQELFATDEYEKADEIVKQIIVLYGENFVETERDYLLMHVLKILRG